MSRMLTTVALLLAIAGLGACSKAKTANVANVPPSSYDAAVPADGGSLYAPASAGPIASTAPAAANAPALTLGDPGPAISPLPPEPTATVALGGGKSYTIQHGDTLWSVSKRFYGSGSRWKEISAANPGLNPEKLRIGQTIRIP